MIPHHLCLDHCHTILTVLCFRPSSAIFLNMYIKSWLSSVQNPTGVPHITKNKTKTKTFLISHSAQFTGVSLILLGRVRYILILGHLHWLECSSLRYSLCQFPHLFKFVQMSLSHWGQPCPNCNMITASFPPTLDFPYAPGYIYTLCVGVSLCVCVCVHFTCSIAFI